MASTQPYRHFSWFINFLLLTYYILKQRSFLINLIISTEIILSYLLDYYPTTDSRKRFYYHFFNCNYLKCCMKIFLGIAMHFFKNPNFFCDIKRFINTPYGFPKKTPTTTGYKPFCPKFIDTPWTYKYRFNYKNIYLRQRSATL